MEDKIRILTEGAKYDVSCSSSGSARRGKRGELGDCAPAGVCHSFTPDGRCVSLLKILMSNECIYNCKYCVNRREEDVERATLTPRELCEITIGFYRRNYIEGLFLSSAVFSTPDETMARLTETVMMLRTEYHFHGYIHLKAIPGCDHEWLDLASLYADRMSENIELPSSAGLKMLAPQKTKESILTPMKHLAAISAKALALKGRSRILPAGQTTQMIIGATPDADGTVLRLSEGLYRNFAMKRVYYSAYVPVGNPSLLPMKPPDLIRENRLYQADWLLRFYGFQAEELLAPHENFDPSVDPKSDWALRHPECFPVEINTAPYEMLLRVPGIGVKSAWRIARARETATLRYEDLKKMKVVLRRAAHFITCDGKYYGCGENRAVLKSYLLAPAFANKEPDQITLADAALLLNEVKQSALTGQL
ncbi:MAG: putative DNA modification/repair radical SAM protein [Clostridia bacterium]|nr:putative DNA modification/repair radical SAM protein [Clostridia bacterium]